MCPSVWPEMGKAEAGEPQVPPLRSFGAPVGMTILWFSQRPQRRTLGPPATELSSRPQRSAVEGPAVSSGSLTPSSNRQFSRYRTRQHSQKMEVCLFKLTSSTCVLDSTENLRQVYLVVELGAGPARRSNRNCFAMPFEPGDKAGLSGAREPLQIHPGVVSAHICIEQRSCRVKNRRLLHTGEFLIRGFLCLSRREPGQ